MKKLSFCCLLLAMLLLAIPCVSAAEDTFSPWRTIPTEHCELSAYPSPERSPLYEKSVVFFGDSLCYARIERGTSNEESVIRASGYAGRIATKYNMELGAFGVSGATVAKSGNYILTKLQAQETNVSLKERQKVDYVILEGGVNDITAQSPLGTIGTETEGFDITTFAGALQQTITQAKKIYPNAMVGYIIAYQMPNDPNPLRSDLENAEKYVNMIIQACEKWEVPYLDFFHDETFNNQIFKEGCITSDGVHMTVKGYDVLSPYIAAWMEFPVQRAPQPQKPIVTPEMTFPDTPDGEETPETETPTPDADPKPKDKNLGVIIGISAGAVVGTAALVAGAVLIVKKKKK